MAQTPSNMPALGLAAPPFSLPDYGVASAGKKTVSLKNAAGPKGLLVMFICNHCPFVKHLRNALADFGKTYQAKGIGIVAINSNDVEKYPDDSPAKMTAEAREAGYTFPYLFDESQRVARAYQAACTPDFFLYDSKLKLVYRGQFDDSRPRNGLPVTGSDLRRACEALLTGKPITAEQSPSIGCNIKWKPGMEPAVTV